MINPDSERKVKCSSIVIEVATGMPRRYTSSIAHREQQPDLHLDRKSTALVGALPPSV